MTFLMDNIIYSNLHEDIIAVDIERNTVYPVEKLEAHLHNIPHLAVSVFVFKNQQLLLQKRADTKYHSGGLWANTVCSHPRWQESPSDCAHRRLEEELGWQIPLQEFGTINYQSKVGELFENEQVSCFFGEYDEKLDINLFNKDEVSTVAWIKYSEISSLVVQKPEIFAEWFKIYIKNHFQMIKNKI